MLTTYFSKVIDHVKNVVKMAKCLVYEPKAKFLNYELMFCKLGVIYLNLWVDHPTNVEDVFHCHLIVIKVIYYEPHNVQKDEVLMKFLLDSHPLHLQWGVVTLTCTISNCNHYLIF
jgi:hypothetical protein